MSGTKFDLGYSHLFFSCTRTAETHLYHRETNRLICNNEVKRKPTSCLPSPSWPFPPSIRSMPTSTFIHFANILPLLRFCLLSSRKRMASESKIGQGDRMLRWFCFQENVTLYSWTLLKSADYVEKVQCTVKQIWPLISWYSLIVHMNTLVLCSCHLLLRAWALLWLPFRVRGDATEWCGLWVLPPLRIQCITHMPRKIVHPQGLECWNLAPWQKWGVSWNFYQSKCSPFEVLATRFAFSLYRKTLPASRIFGPK